MRERASERTAAVQRSEGGGERTAELDCTPAQKGVEVKGVPRLARVLAFEKFALALDKGEDALPGVGIPLQQTHTHTHSSWIIRSAPVMDSMDWMAPGGGPLVLPPHPKRSRRGRPSNSRSSTSPSKAGITYCVR